jgi:hypothetical protein
MKNKINLQGASNNDDRLRMIFPEQDHSSESWKEFVSDFNKSLQIHKVRSDDERREGNQRGRKKDVIKEQIKRVKKFITFLQSSLFPHHDQPLVSSSYVSESNLQRDERYITLIDLLTKELAALNNDLLYAKNPSHRLANKIRPLFSDDLMTILYNHLSIEPSTHLDSPFSEYIAYGTECLENRPYDASNVYRTVKKISQGVAFQDKEAFYKIEGLPLTRKLSSVSWKEELNEVRKRQKAIMDEYRRGMSPTATPEEKAYARLIAAEFPDIAS